MRRAWISGLALGLTIGMRAATTSACTVVCLRAPQTAEESLRSAKVVLIGTVQKVELGQWASVRVDELYKGGVPETLTIDSGFGSDCRMWLEEGKQYVLFLYRAKGVSRLVPHHNCEPSGEVALESVAVEWLRRRKPIAPRASSLNPPSNNGLKLTARGASDEARQLNPVFSGPSVTVR